MRTLRLFGILLPALALAGCHIDHHDDADVETYWLFDGYGCWDADVRNVRVILEEIHGGDVYDSGRIPCEEGSALFLDVRSGSYMVRAYGYGWGGPHVDWELHRKVRIHRGFNEMTLDLAPTW